VWNLTNVITFSALSGHVGNAELTLWCLAIVAVALACVLLCSPARRRRQAARATQNKDILRQMSLPLEPEYDDNPERRGELS
jgi:cytochrome c-type biogenesis protein CcmH/NrfF